MPDPGPVLHYRGQREGRYHYAVVLAAGRQPPSVKGPDGRELTTKPLLHHDERVVWRVDFSVPVATVECFDYRVDDHRYTVALPVGDRLRVAFTACNGDHDNDPADYDEPRRNHCWLDLGRQHEADPYHLLLQGGDQLYADDLWREIPQLVQWARKSRRERVCAPASEALESAIADFYFQRYCRLWAQAALRAPLACIPQLMMWDDHDIFDGWGSHPPALQACPVYQAIWRQARRHFLVFQRGLAPDEAAEGHAGWAVTLGPLGVVAPDLRSTRTRTRIIDEAGWRWLEDALTSLADRQRLLLVSTVPVANVDLSWIERLLVALPGAQSYQDDLRDQWNSFVHRREWRRLVQLLLDWRQSNGVPVDIVSGEIHLAAFGSVHRGDTRIHQLISSGVVHRPPPQWLARLYHWLASGPRPARHHAVMHMHPLPGVGRRYLAERNWLTLEIAGSRMTATWRPEGGDRGMTVEL